MYKKQFMIALAIVQAIAMSACSITINTGEHVDKPATSSITSETTDNSDNNSDVESDITENQDSEANSEPSKQSTVGELSKNTYDTPIGLGEQATVTIYNAKDGVYKPVNVKVNKVLRDTTDHDAIVQYIEKHNAISPDYKKISVEEMALPDDIELCVVEYEVTVPSDFPAHEYGIQAPEIRFNVEKQEAGGIPQAINQNTVYVGIGSSMEKLNTDEQNSDTNYKPGNTYKIVSMFTMVKGFEDFELAYTYYNVGENVGDSDAITTYFSIK